jgi:hypothetical protein
MSDQAAMSPDREAILKDIASKLPVTPNARKRKIWIACLVIGAISLIYLFMLNPTRAWCSYAINVIF